jgi:hypothetical protein
MRDDLWALMFAVAIPALFVLGIWRWARGPRTRIGLRSHPDRPRSFGYKSTWLAVRSEDPGEVVAAIRAVDARFRDATPCNWEHGLERVFGALMSREAFVTPSVRGWVLVAGYSPDAHPAMATRGDGSGALRALERLGTALDRPVHYFGSHRGVGYVDWVVVEDGQTKRATHTRMAPRTTTSASPRRKRKRSGWSSTPRWRETTTTRARSISPTSRRSSSSRRDGR